MAEKSFPWTANGTGDGTSGGYTALEWGEIWRRLFSNGREANGGVAKGHGNELAVSGTASPVAVATGAAQVYGKHYYNDASLNLTVTTPVVGTTGGHIILRLDWAAQTVRAVAVRNTDGVNSTPALTQSTSTQWEIRLATFTITTGGVITLTDAREFLRTSIQIVQANLANLCVGTAQVIDAAITTAKHALDSVDDTIVGNRVPALTRRQGGDASNWSTNGTTTYTPTAVRKQVGVVATGGGGTVTVTFPVAFSQPPVVVATAQAGSAVILNIDTVTATTVTFATRNTAGSGVIATVMWEATGPE